MHLENDHKWFKGKLSDCDFLTPAYYLWSIFCFDLEVVYLEHILLLLCRLLITKVALCQDFWPEPSGHHWPDLIDRNMSNFLSRYVPFGELWKLLSLFVSKFYSIFGVGISNEGQSAFDIWKGNVHSFLEPPSDCWVKSPGQIGGSQNQNSITVVTNSLHLNQKLCFYPSWDLVLFWGSVAGYWVNLVYKNDGGFFSSSHGKKSFKCFFGLTYVFGHEIWCWDAEEGAVFLLSDTCFSKIGLSGSWGLNSDIYTP